MTTRTNDETPRYYEATITPAAAGFGQYEQSQERPAAARIRATIADERSQGNGRTIVDCTASPRNRRRIVAALVEAGKSWGEVQASVQIGEGSGVISLSSAPAFAGFAESLVDEWLEMV